MRRSHSLGCIAALAITFASNVSPVLVSGQQVLKRAVIEADRDAKANARADTLEARARTMYSAPWLYVDAARLHRRAAGIRGSDPRAIASLRSAAWLYSVAGKYGVARGVMEDAAERAKAVGDVESAANSYIDAAFLAIADGRADQVSGILTRTRSVLRSPLLSDVQRASILQRIGESPQLAKLDSTRKDKP